MIDDGAPRCTANAREQEIGRWMSSMRTNLFTVCLDDDGHPVQRAVRDMTAGEMIAAIDHLTAGSTRIAAREKLARLRQVVAQKHPRSG